MRVRSLGRRHRALHVGRCSCSSSRVAARSRRPPPAAKKDAAVPVVEHRDVALTLEHLPEPVVELRSTTRSRSSTPARARSARCATRFPWEHDLHGRDPAALEAPGQRHLERRGGLSRDHRRLHRLGRRCDQAARPAGDPGDRRDARAGRRGLPRDLARDREPRDPARYRPPGTARQGRVCRRPRAPPAPPSATGSSQRLLLTLVRSPRSRSRRAPSGGS